MRKALSGTALLFSLIGTAVFGQSNGIPREFPPADFTGNQFVDSEGCAFIRADLSGTTNWVPRVDGGRRQLCYFQPTFPNSVAAAEPARAVEAEPEVASAIIDEPAAEDLPLIIFPTDAEVASTRAPTGLPAPRPEPAAPTPRVVPARASAPAPAPSPAPALAPAPVAEPEPVQLTRGEVCDGKFGPQPGYISSRTGETLDCGPAPAPASRAVVEEQPLRMTLAAICAETAASGRRFLNANTREPIVCPETSAVAEVAAPTVQSSNECTAIPAASGEDVRCGPQPHRPWTVAGSDGTSTRSKSPSLGLLGRTPVPASNPAPAVVAQQPKVPGGFQRAFTDGRHNPRRGLPAGASTAPVGSAQATQASAASYRYVQVGSFGVHSNADALLNRLSGMGLRIASGNSGGMKIVAVGPFNSAAELQRALGQVRAMGFPDAFLRN